MIISAPQKKKKPLNHTIWKGCANPNPFEFLTYVFELLHIIQTIFYENEQTFEIAFNKVIRLDNDKYHLLCNEDYNTYSSILRELCSK